MNDKIQHISTSSHWYYVDNRPCYEICVPGGILHEPTIRDAKLHKLLPSVTSYEQILAKPAIINWIVQGVLEIAAKTPRLITIESKGEFDEDWIKRVSQLSQLERSKAPQRGTELHGMIGDYLTSKIMPTDPVGVESCINLQSWLDDNKWVNIRSEVNVANPSEGIAGRVDIICDGLIADIKTTAKPPRTPWPEWGRQLAGYQLCLGIHPSEAYSLVIDTKSGELTPHKWEVDKMKEALDIFKIIMSLWRKLKNYDPRQ